MTNWAQCIVCNHYLTQKSLNETTIEELPDKDAFKILKPTKHSQAHMHHQPPQHFYQAQIPAQPTLAQPTQPPTPKRLVVWIKAKGGMLIPKGPCAYGPADTFFKNSNVD